MSKKKKKYKSPPQQPKPQTPVPTMQATPPVQRPTAPKVQPERMSLTAHDQVRKYLSDSNRNHFNKEDLNAVLRLSQHLRVFGLLSAVGYVNQSNAQQGEVRQRTVPVWHSLLGQHINENQFPLPNATELMTTVVDMAKNHPAQYMATWQGAIALSNHWNFWARAYSQE